MAIPSITETAITVDFLLRGEVKDITKDELIGQYIRWMAKQKHSIAGRLAKELVRLCDGE